MAKKTTASKIAPITKKIAAKATISTPVRNSAIPKVVVTPRKKIEITGDMIASRAYEIYSSGKGGSESDNWFAAERELRSGV